MKKIIYTCITGKYDQLTEIKTSNHAICFTDQDIKSDTWEIRKIAAAPKIYRKIKICPHLFLPDHQQSIWVDGNITPIDIDQFAKDKTGFWVMRHPNRRCIYQEALRCLENGKDNWEIILRQVDHYRASGYPPNNGLIASGVILRDNQLLTQKFSEAWWSEVAQYSVRDQISFNYVTWKLRFHFNTFEFLKGFNIQTHLVTSPAPINVHEFINDHKSKK